MNTKPLLALAFAGLFAVTASAALTGVTINGEPLNDAAGSSGAGWAYTPPTLTLSGAGPFVISGTNTAGKVCVIVQTGVTCDVTLSNLTLAATDNQQCPFALESGANVTLFLAGNNSLRSGDRRAGIEVATGRTLSITNAPGDDAAFLSVRGAYLGAGIGSGGSGNGGTITISGGTVEATGGSWSAGIGGGGYGGGGTVTINGGIVTATGGYNGAGIGGGDDNNGGTVTISGGVVTATGLDGGAGIGGGEEGDGGTVAISGGTVFAQGSDGGADMGPGGNGMTAAANTFTGGSIRLAAGNASLQPSNGQDPVGCAKVTGFQPGARVDFTDPGNLPTDYGTTDIFADAGGAIHLWLPDGDYHFTANGLDCTAKIKNGTGPSGVTVNGEEAAFGPSDPDNAGWSFSAATRTVSLSGTGPFTLSGANEIGGVCFAVPSGVANTVVLSNLTLRTTIADQCVFALGQNANVSLVLAGTNTLASGFGRAGIEVTTGRTLSITNAPGDDAGALRVTGGDYGAGIGGDYGGTGGMVAIHGGTVAATGGDRGAGIGGGRGGTGGTVTIHGGTVTAEGGRWGTGIGGGDYGDGGTVTINGGTVFAQGDDYCAGIGGGDEGNGGTVTINGGTVTATSAGYGAGIGGGDEGSGGTVAINGGTVFAQGDTGGADIGPGRNGAVAGANTFTGGSIGLGGAFIAPEPSNNTEAVFCAVVTGFAPGAWVEFTNPGTLPAGFGTDDIFADDSGAIYLWLPNGTYTFTANGRDCTVTIQNGIGPTGVTINGADVALGPPNDAAGWAYDAATGILSLTNAGPFTLSGANAVGRVQVVVLEGVASTVTLSNLTLQASGDGQCAFALETNAVVSLYLEGINTLASGSSRAGLDVAAGRTLSITNAPGDEAGALTATSEDSGAGIGGGANIGGGTVIISGGIVTATGGEYFAAGIGGGMGGAGGTVSISGGTVTANGGNLGAGIGSGGYAGVTSGGDGGTVDITGGTVTANGGDWSAGIGGGDGDAGGTVTISGGTVFATGGKYGAGIGGGNNDDNPDGIAGSGGTVTISGGRVTATGGKCAAGIGGGTGQQIAGSAGAALAVSGGTVFATGGAGGAPGIGSGLGNVGEGDTGVLPDASGTSTFTGGSIRIDGGYAANDPTDGSKRVWCVTVPDLTPNAVVAVGSLGTYGVNDLFTDEAGQLYLWLPNDNYDFTAGGADYEATVSDADTIATLKAAPPVSAAYLTFSSADTFTITPSAVSWNGALFYSTNTTDWSAFDRNGATAALDSGSGEYRLYFRGTGNTLITGGNLAYWEINAAPASVDCSGNIETLLDYATVDGGGHPAMIANCFANLFKDCTALGSAPELPATNLINNCYVGMFRGCTGLTNAPVLPATTLPGGCYQEMFRDCTSLVQAPALPAMTLSSSCYKGMFTNCTALATAPELSATTLGATCYQYMFAGCTGLTNAPALQAMTLVAGCYHSMFFGCTGLTQLPELPATNLVPFCYAFMFKDCTGVALHAEGTAPTWGISNDAAEAMGWNTNMLAGTGGTFTGDPAIGATYYYTPSTPPVSTAYLTFASANAFTVKPPEKLWDGTLEYSTNAADWVLFTIAGAEAAAVAPNDYRLHIRGTNSSRINGDNKPGWTITATAPVDCSGNIETLLDYATVDAGGHPAMATYCFANLFNGCTALSSAPALPATNLAECCYFRMFQGCTGLTTALELPATTLANWCYKSMFQGCTGLTNTPALQAMTLANRCYDAMFYGCTGLTVPPALPATNMAYYCYANMFYGCTGIKLNTEGLGTPWGIPAGVQGARGWCENMLAGTGGTFTGDPAIGATYYYTPSTPPVSTAYLTFSSANAFTVKPQETSWNGTIEYSTDTTNWTAFTIEGAAAVAPGTGEYRLYLRGSNNTYITGAYKPGWTITAAAQVACSGNIETLLDYATVDNGGHPAMDAYCFANLFKDCTALISAPALTATTLANYACNSMFKGCTSLAAAPAFVATNLANYCCQSMFEGCTALTNAPALPAGTLATSCYASMFKDCTSLAEAPGLAATNLANYCCYAMFSGCTSLTNAPTLPATTLAGQCYYKMFSGCTGLTATPLLPATNLASYCYANMFEGCTGLTRLPTLPATTLATACYNAMFSGCTSITLHETGTAPTWGIPAEAQDEDALAWNQNMLAGTGGTFTGNPAIGATYYYTATPPVSTAYLTFASTNTFTVTPQEASWDGTLQCSTDTTNWTAFTTAGATAAANANGEYKLYLRGSNNTRITGLDKPGWTIAATAPVACTGNIETLLDYATVDNGEHPEMDAYCFANLFNGCTALVSAPALPTTTLADYCYYCMFQGCTGLTVPPELPATTLAETCYCGMFLGCTSLTNAPALPATTLTEWCYYQMFSGCTGLTVPPELPATTLANYCYGGMFSGCTGLTSPPALPVTTLAYWCYAGMFYNCTGLTMPPALPATTLAEGCYNSMFGDCTGLTHLPDLPATTLANYCYYRMFEGCTGIKLNTEGPGIPWGIPAGANPVGSWNQDMLASTGGTFTGNPVIGTTYYYTPSTPPVSTAYLTFASTNTFTVKPQEASWNGTLECSTDTTNWVAFTTAGATAAANANGEYKLYLRGSNNTRITGSGQPGWMITAAAPVACSGNIQTLLDYATVDAGDHPAMADSCFASLFHACTALSSAPALPATNLTDSCYFAMFVGCRGLTEAPVLPATTLANNCCSSMFQACTGLTNAPALPATNLADHCYANMFYGCTGLTQAPALPATNLAGSCYRAMFANCTSLAEAPTLPATTMADSCCSFMFSDCTTLTTPPVLPATNLAGNCYTAMFSGCMGLTEAPTLPATTLAYGCYKEMFYGCTGLTSLPELSATTMADFCYRAMFYGCTGITLYEDGTAPTWGIPAGAQAAQYWNFDMLAGTGGTFTGDPVIGAIYYYTPPQVGVQVVFDATGGAFADGASAVTQVCVNVYGELPVAAREGYTLVGWFDGCTNGAAQAATGGALLYGTAHTLHARWTAVPGTTPASIFAYTVNADGTVTITGFRDPNQKVTKLVLPDMIDGRFVTAIAPGAFANSTSGMTEVFFPVFCTSIGSKAFLSVTTITHLEFPPTRDWRNPTQPANLHIGSYAFSGAKGLTALTLPAEVASLGDYAFNNAVNLKRITILGHPTLGKQVFRSVGNTPGGVTLHLDPALAGNATYMATLTSGMLNVTVETDAIITGLQIRAIGFAPSGRVVLGVTIERAAEWGAPDLASFRVKHRAQLGGASNVLVPVAAVLEADGSVTLEIPMPAGGNAFFRVFILN